MYKNKTKRVLDLILAISLFPFIAFASFIIMLLIIAEDNGPVFYKGKRLGEKGTIFKMYKFRSMKVNAPDLRNEDGSTFNSKDDPRLTKTGSFLRRTSLDELPQIINVLLGHMSFVGPRPDLPEHITYYEDNEMKKLEVKPGITGYNQAFYRNSIEWKERLKNDVYYSENISLFFDFKILIVTLVNVLNKKGIYKDV